MTQGVVHQAGAAQPVYVPFTGAPAAQPAAPQAYVPFAGAAAGPQVLHTAPFVPPLPLPKTGVVPVVPVAVAAMATPPNVSTPVSMGGAAQLGGAAHALRKPLSAAPVPAMATPPNAPLSMGGAALAGNAFRQPLSAARGVEAPPAPAVVGATPTSSVINRLSQALATSADQPAL
jgi:hypothetical protein